MKFRDAGIPWLGEIPAHWDLWKVGHLARVGNGSTPERDNTEYWTDGSLPWLNSSVVNQAEVTTAEQFVTELARKECHLPLLHPGTVLVAITGQGKTRGQAVVLSIDATINQHMAFVAPNPGLIAPWFLRWAFYRAYEYLRSISDDAGGTKGALTCEDVASLKIPVPPLEEQRAIIARLAHETARIDALLLAKQRLIDLLAEKRKAIIATAVTRGLDPNVKLRDSGVQWLGEIPAHWEHRNLRFCCAAIQTGGTPAPEFLDYDGDDGLDWFTPGDFSESLIPQRSTRRVAPGALSSDDLKMFPAGAVLVVGIGATLGKVGLLSRPASANQQVNALIPRDEIDGSFLTYEISVLAELLRVSANTATLPILNQQRMGDVPVLVPPLGEQHAIVEHIARETAKLDAVRAATERTIALLKERRSALIAAAVTGQLEVKESAA